MGPQWVRCSNEPSDNRLPSATEMSGRSLNQTCNLDEVVDAQSTGSPPVSNSLRDNYWDNSSRLSICLWEKQSVKIEYWFHKLAGKLTKLTAWVKNPSDQCSPYKKELYVWNCNECSPDLLPLLWGLMFQLLDSNKQSQYCPQWTQPQLADRKRDPWVARIWYWRWRCPPEKRRTLLLTT